MRLLASGDGIRSQSIEWANPEPPGIAAAGPATTAHVGEPPSVGRERESAARLKDRGASLRKVDEHPHVLARHRPAVASPSPHRRRDGHGGERDRSHTHDPRFSACYRMGRRCYSHEGGPRQRRGESLALSNRSAGSLANAVSTAASTPGGIVFRTSVGRSGSALTTFATIAWIELPVNGGSPVSISYVTAPNA